MANPEHLEILKQGAEVWNEWCAKHSGVRPDLSEANLPWAVLRNANLSGATLRRAHLSEALLNSATLSGADLSGIDRTKVDLSAAVLD